MLSVVDKFELIDRADELARNRDFERLVQLVESLGTGGLDADPLFEFYHLFAETQLGNATEALRIMRATSPTFELLQDTRLYRRFRNVCGILLTQVGRLPEARAAFVDVLAASESRGDRQLAADAVMNLGVVADMFGQWDEALAAHWRALTIFTQLADHVMVAGCHHNLGMTYRQLGLLSEADSHFEIALELYQRHGTRLDVISTVLERSLLLVRMGDGLVAEAMARTAYKEVRQIRNLRLAGEAQRILGVISLAGGQHRRARRYLRGSLSSARLSENLLLEAESAEELAKLCDRVGQYAEAADWRERSVELYLSIGCLGRANNLRSIQI